MKQHFLQQAHRLRTKDSLQQCTVEWCSRLLQSKNSRYCTKHYKQYQRHGEVFRTPYDPNEFLFVGQDCIIVLRNRYGEVLNVAVVDRSEYDLVKRYKWCYSGHGYAFGSPNRVYLHRLLMPEHYELDHKDGNGLNNRRCNLRGCTHQQNMQNRKDTNNTTGYKGVTLLPSGNYRAEIASKHLGVWSTDIEAAKAYDKAAKKYFGEFASLNFKESI